MKSNNDITAIRETFTSVQIPTNVRAGSYLGRRSVLRRFSNFALVSGAFPSKGTFVYRAGSKTVTIEYEGRNLQFQALYDPAYKHGYELETALVMKKLCRGRGAFWDVGANWGYFSLLVASFPEFQGSIASFEPNPKTFKDLSRTVEQAGLSGRVRTHNLGLGAENCEMVVSESGRFHSGLSQLKKVGDGVRVPVASLDSLRSERPHFVKIDAEGMELEILKGATKTLKEARPFVVFENFLDRKDPGKTYQPIEFLRSQDYRIFLPGLRFQIQGRPVVVSYGQDFDSLFAADPSPDLCLFEVVDLERFLLGEQLNLLGVPFTRLEEPWACGIKKMTA
jgi:FkbM family methyltransferase